MLCMSLAGAALAADTSAGGPALRQARAQWDRGSLEQAELLYREALEKGGLAPSEVLEGYVRLGSIRAALKKKDQAFAAFRAASILDATFTVPTEAQALGLQLADKAKRDTAKIGSIQLAIQVPKETAAAKSFKVTATLDKGHLPIVSKIGVTAKDGTTGKEISLDAKPDESVEFEIGSDITLPGASILIHVDALDGHANRLASAEDRVRVPDSGAGVAPAVATNNTQSSTTSSGTTTTTTKQADTVAPIRHGGGFWSSPWPYVIGGIAVAGIGTSIFFATRPAENIAVGAPAVVTPGK
jgi:hypothetical protein